MLCPGSGSQNGTPRLFACTMAQCTASATSLVQATLGVGSVNFWSCTAAWTRLGGYLVCAPATHKPPSSPDLALASAGSPVVRRSRTAPGRGCDTFLLSCVCDGSGYYRVVHGAGLIPNETQSSCRTRVACLILPCRLPPPNAPSLCSGTNALLLPHAIGGDGWGLGTRAGGCSETTTFSIHFATAVRGVVLEVFPHPETAGTGWQLDFYVCLRVGGWLPALLAVLGQIACAHAQGDWDGQRPTKNPPPPLQANTANHQSLVPTPPIPHLNTHKFTLPVALHRRFKKSREARTDPNVHSSL